MLNIYCKNISRTNIIQWIKLLYVEVLNPLDLLVYSDST